MKVDTRAIMAHADVLHAALSGLNSSAPLSRSALTRAGQGLPQADQQTLQAAYDYLKQRGVVTPQKMDNLISTAQSNVTRADRNNDGFISSSEARNLGRVSGPLAHSADGFDSSTNAATTAGATGAASQGGFSPQNINNAIDRLHVETNSKYLPTGRRGTASRTTHCNQFAQDVLRGAGVPRSNTPTGLANNMNRWLNNQGQQHGWHQVSAAEAQRMANQGHPVLASWDAGGNRHGHVAVVRPGHNDGQVHIAQAGGHNYSDTTVGRGFGRHTPQYFVYDGPTSR